MIKQIKTEKINEKINALKRMKLARSFVIFIKLCQILSILNHKLNLKRRERLLAFQVSLCCLKIQLHFRKQLRLRNRMI